MTVANPPRLNAVRISREAFEVHVRYCFDGYNGPSTLGLVTHSRTARCWSANLTYLGRSFEVRNADFRALLAVVRQEIDTMEAEDAVNDDWVDVDTQTERAIEASNDYHAWLNQDPNEEFLMMYDPQVNGSWRDDADESEDMFAVLTRDADREYKARREMGDLPY